MAFGVMAVRSREGTGTWRNWARSFVLSAVVTAGLIGTTTPSQAFGALNAGTDVALSETAGTCTMRVEYERVGSLSNLYVIIDTGASTFGPGTVTRYQLSSSFNTRSAGNPLGSSVLTGCGLSRVSIQTNEANGTNYTSATNYELKFTGTENGTPYEWHGRIYSSDASAVPQGFLTKTDLSPPDNTPPTLSVFLAPDTIGNDDTPRVIISTNEAGTVTYGGSCSSTVNAVAVGPTAIVYNTLGEGTYSDCTITVTDSSANASNPLAIPAFTIDTAQAAMNGNATRAVPTTRVTSATELIFRVRFNEPINGLSPAAFDTSVPISGAIRVQPEGGDRNRFLIIVPVSDIEGSIFLTEGDTTGVTDDAGNTGFAWTASQDYLIDRTPPSITLSGPTSAVTGRFQITVSISESVSDFDPDADLVVENGDVDAASWSKNGNNWVGYILPNDSPVSIQALTSSVTDAAGQKNTSPSNTLSVAFDNTPPALSMITPVSTAGNDATPALTFNSNEAGTITYGGSCSSATTVAEAGNNTITLNALGEGTYSDCALAVTDAVGNQSDPLSIPALTIDTTPPTLTAAIGSSNANPNFAKAGDTITLNFSASEVLYATPGVTIGGKPANVVSPGGALQIFTATTTVDGTIADGELGFEISGIVDRASNPADNVTETGNGDAITIDQTAPKMIGNARRADPTVQNTNSDVLRFDVQFDESVSGVGAGSLRVFGGSTGVISGVDPRPGNVQRITVSGGDLADFNGSVVLNPLDLSAIVDGAGNRLVSFNGSAGFFLDNIAPTATITGPVNANVPFNVTVTFNEAVVNFDPLNLVVTGGAVDEVTWQTGSGTSFTGTIIPSGSVVTVQASAGAGRDASGNQSAASNTLSVGFDGTAPVISLVTPIPTPANNTAPSFTLTSNEAGTLTYGGACSSATTAMPAGPLAIALNALADGTYSNCTVQVTDAVGNASNVVTLPAFTIDAAAPILTQVSIRSNSALGTNKAAVGDTITLSFGSNEPLAGLPNVTIGGKPAAVGAAVDGSLGSQITQFFASIVITQEVAIEGQLAFSIASPSDAAGNAASDVTTTTDGSSILVDTVAPRAELSTRVLPPIQASAPTPFILTITFTEPVTGFAGTGNFQRGNVTLSDFQPLSDRAYSVTATPTGGGNIFILLQTNGITDPHGNTLAFVEGLRVDVNDDVSPRVVLTTVTRQFKQSESNAFDVDLNFNEPVSTPDKNGIAVENGEAVSITPVIEDSARASNAGRDQVAAPATRFILTVQPDGLGDVRVTVPAGLTADLRGNGNQASEPLVVQMVDDNVPSVVVATSVNQINRSALAPFTATYTFSEDVTFAGDALTSLNAGISNATASDFRVETGNTVFAATITPDGSGDISVALAAGVAADGSGNASLGAEPVIVTLIDDVAPKGTLAGVPETTNGTDPFDVTVTFDKPVAGLEIGDFVVTHASVGAPVAVAGEAAALAEAGEPFVGATSYRATITPDGNGNVSVTVAANAVQDAAGNSNTEAIGPAVAQLDRTDPFLVSIEREGDESTDADMLSWKFTFSEPISGFGPDDVELKGVNDDATITVQPLGPAPAQARQARLGKAKPAAPDSAGTDAASQYRVSVTSQEIAQGNLTVEVGLADGATIADSTGNSMTSFRPTGADESAIVVVNDTVAPTVTITAPETVYGPFEVRFEFSEPVSGFTGSDLALTNAVASEPERQDAATPAGLASIFTATVTPSEHGAITIAVIADAVRDAAGNANAQSATTTVDYVDVLLVQTRTGAVINNFLYRRARNIVANEPDLSGRLDERGGIGATEKFAFTAEGDGTSMSIAFGGSLSRLMSSQLLGYGEGGQRASGEAGAPRFNVWVRGSLSKSSIGGQVQDFGIVHLGADYRINQAFLVGVMGQIDQAEEFDPTTGIAASGTGWMIGPYAVLRLQDNLVLDGRLAWGRSDNKVAPFGTYTDSFDTERFLVRGQLTGDFDMSGWTVSPQLALTYLREDQKAYVNTANIAIAGRTVELGQVSFGPTISRMFEFENGNRITPRVSIKGLWNFKDTGIADIDTGLVSSGTGNNLRARADFGLSTDFGMSANLDLSGFYEGIGANDNSVYGINAKLRVPF